MASVTMPANAIGAGSLRPLNILRDLPQVADLIELCFESSMDDEGQSYLQQMRRASRDRDFLSWAGKVMDNTSMPLSGFVWEEHGRIVGNASLVYQTFRGRRTAMIANVATHPDQRRRGIGRALTEMAMKGAVQKGARELWLQVRHDNPVAIRLYRELGFIERARRTTYTSGAGKRSAALSTSADGPSEPSKETQPPAQQAREIRISRPEAVHWPLQHAWLERAHPDELSWYARWDWKALGPGWQNWLQRVFGGLEGRHWAAMRDGEPLASVHWMPMQRVSDALWAAAPLDADPAGISLALEAARRDLVHFRRLTVEYPEGEMAAGIEAAGFTATRTLIWMRAGATLQAVPRIDR